MAVYRPDIPPHVAEIIRHLPPDLKRSIKQSIRRLSLNPYDAEKCMRIWSNDFARQQDAGDR